MTRTRRSIFRVSRDSTITSLELSPSGEKEQLREEHSNNLKNILWLNQEEYDHHKKVSKQERKDAPVVLEYSSSFGNIWTNSPNVCLTKRTPMDSLDTVLSKIDGTDFQLMNSSCAYSEPSYMFVDLDKMIVLSIMYTKSGDEDAYLTVELTFAPLEENKDYIFDIFDSMPEKPKDSKNNFKIICQGSHSIYTETMRLAPKPIKDDRYDILYGEDFPLETIKSFFVDDELDREGGLMLLHGDAGSGKTNFIKNMIAETDKTVIYIPSSMASVLTSPAFISFLMDQKDAIFVIEDAEEILGDRNQGTQNILEMTDGLLKDSLNIRVVCTFNVEESKVDEALKRKGRLYYSHHFDQLDVEEATNVCKFYDIDHEPTEPITLAELFNISKDNGEEVSKKQKMGFAGMINR